MADNLKGIPFSNDDEGQSFPDMAKSIVSGATEGNVYLVWFAYVLGHWKALCSTDLPDGRYYEVTFNREKQVAYLDTYVKADNLEITIR